MHVENTLEEIQGRWKGSLGSYLLGFFGSLILTIASFLSVIYLDFPKLTVVLTVVVLALAQAAVQLHYFFHIGQEQKPRWESMIFYSMISVILVIVLGTLWIMFDLDIRVMSHMLMDGSHD